MKHCIAFFIYINVILFTSTSSAQTPVLSIDPTLHYGAEFFTATAPESWEHTNNAVMVSAIFATPVITGILGGDEPYFSFGDFLFIADNVVGDIGFGMSYP